MFSGELMCRLALAEPSSLAAAPCTYTQRQEAVETSPLQVFVVEKVDLAISKLGRFGDQDIADIHTLFDHGLCIEHFRSKAREAIDYAVGNRDKLTGNLDQVINLYKL